MSEEAGQDLNQVRQQALREGASAEALIQATIRGLRVLQEMDTDSITDWDSILREMDSDLTLALEKLNRRQK